MQELAHMQTYSVLPEGTTDDLLISYWLHELSKNTQSSYRTDIEQFRTFTHWPLQLLKLPHLLEYKEELMESGLEVATIGRKLKSVKSLLTFAYKAGYTPFNIGVMVKVPKLKEDLAERILTEEEVLSIIIQEKNMRNHAILRLFYASAIRVSELCNLQWRDVQPRGETGQITVQGKGEKTRVILLSKATYQEIIALRKNAAIEVPVFPSHGAGRGKAKPGGKLDESQVWLIVEQAAIRANIAIYQETILRKGKKQVVTKSRVSPHWLRHSHATHALENGASIILVKETLGHSSIETTAKYTHAHPDKSSSQYLKV